MIVRITKAKAMSFPLHSYPLYKKGLMIAEMVETLENWLALVWNECTPYRTCCSSLTVFLSIAH